jgi:O-antigen/teichoic acid export membrane protein
VAGLGDRILRSSLFRVLNPVLNIAISFFMIPYVIGHVGDRWYGLWILIGTMIGYFGFLDLGIGTANERYVARALGRKDDAEIGRVFSSSVLLFAIVGAVTLVLTAVVIAVCPRFVKDAADIPVFRVVFLIVGVDMALSFPVRGIYGFLYAHIRYDVVNVFNIAKTLIRTTLIVLALERGHGIVALAVATLAGDLAEYAANVLYLRSRYPEALVRLRDFSKKTVRQLYDYSIYSFISAIAKQLRFNVDAFIITAMLGLVHVTHYNIGSRIAGYYLLIVINAISSIKPLFSKLEGEGNYETLRERYHLSLKLNMILSFFIGGALLIYGKAFILRWMGPNYLDSWHVLAVLAVAQIFNTIQVTPSTLLYGISKHKIYSFIVVLEGFANLGISILLARRFGIVGVALGTLLPVTLTTLVFIPLYANRVIGFPNARFYRSLGRIGAVSAAIHALSWLAVRGFITPSFGRIAGLGLLTSILFLGISTVALLSRSERARLRIPF